MHTYTTSPLCPGCIRLLQQCGAGFNQGRLQRAIVHVRVPGEEHIPDSMRPDLFLVHLKATGVAI